MYEGVVVGGSVVPANLDAGGMVRWYGSVFVVGLCVGAGVMWVV